MPMTAYFEEVIHGVTVRDHYRWLEDRSLPETDAWIHEQQRRYDAYFKACPELAALEHRVREYLDVTVIDQPARVAGRYFYRKRDIGGEQGCICVREIPTYEEKVLVDPLDSGPYASVGIYRISPGGAYLAYEFRRGGEDRMEIRILDVRTGVTIPDRTPVGYARGFAFASDGFFYCHEIENASDEHSIRYHRFGEVGEDRTVFRIPRSSGSRLILKTDQRRLGAMWLRPSGSQVLVDFLIAEYTETPAWFGVFRKKRMPYTPILSHGDIFALVETESKSTRLIQLSEDGQELRTIVPELEFSVRQLVITQDRIFISYLRHGVPVIDSWSRGGKRLPSLTLPSDGSVQILPQYGPDVETIFYACESFDTPTLVYEHIIGANTSTLWWRRSAANHSKRHAVKEVRVASKDGTLIPMTLVFDASRPLGGASPVIMTSYGGFGLPMKSQFSVLVSIMIEQGATFALPHVRGGGEFGKLWHDAGRRTKRQVAFDDFIAAARWLCDNGVTTPERLAIFGGSNAGLLVGAVMTQCPDLFRAVLCIAPLLDMLRYEYFDQAVKWRQEYGTVEDPEDFQALYAYSPYHHVATDVDYPATMFISGDKDDRCNPAHVRKMAAALQERSAQISPVIVDYTAERGHAPMLPLSMRVSALTRRIAFLCHELRIAVPHGDSDEASRL